MNEMENYSQDQELIKNSIEMFARGFAERADEHFAVLNGKIDMLYSGFLRLESVLALKLADDVKLALRMNEKVDEFEKKEGVFTRAIESL